MKTYCMDCGHVNEYTGAAPKKCEKCGMEFAQAARDIIRIAINEKPINITKASSEPEVEVIEDSEFDSYMVEEPEPMSQQEIEKIFLSKGKHQTLNLKDLMDQGYKEHLAKTKASETKASKPRGRPRKQK